jgi:hypothetical protein
LLEEDDNNGLLTSDKLLPFRGVGQKHPRWRRRSNISVSKRLLIRFSQPDRVSIVKEYDGQVKTPEDRNREQDDDAHNEVDGEDAIKL